MNHIKTVKFMFRDSDKKFPDGKHYFINWDNDWVWGLFQLIYIV